ncbi:ABC transporter substrate-binding protein [Williamsia deligens]|uniref:ABC transporter substrate-binding protein n=1 Tax=Williamsia deligens TaxID=321325 RepID=A0ABW3G7J9_9NOCA|nr:ABC transporter substrate-binding protein [Williamsia deligens]MCP2193143.1 sulfonate transport system substrate-binding protein [Williamsia deligens]
MRCTPIRSIGALAVVLVATLTLAGCVSRESDERTAAPPSTVDAAQLSTVTLNVGDQKGGTQALLQASGQLSGTPYKVSFSTFTSGPPQVEAATAGRIDFAVTGNTPPIFGAASDARIKVVSAYTNDASGDQILVPKTSTARSVADLRGKRIAFGKGSSAHGHLLLQLSKAGLTPADVQLVPLQPADALTAFTAGQVDAWAIWDPFTAIAQQQTGARTLTTAQGVANGYGFGIASQQALGDPAKNTALADLVSRIAKASAWAKANPTEWAAKYSAAVKIDPVAGETAQKRSLRPAIPLDDSIVASEQKLYDAFVAAKQIPAGKLFSDFVDTRYDAAVKEATK